MADVAITSDTIALINQAETIIQQNWPNAILVEAHGTSVSGVAENAIDIDTWLFAAELLPPDYIPQATVLLRYAVRRFGTPHHVAQPWLGNVFERIPRTMSLNQATLLLRTAGFNDPFRNVTLRRPTTFPAQTEASYFFGMIDGRLIAVGTQTGRVSPVRLELSTTTVRSLREVTGM